MSHFTHDRSALLRPAPQRRSVPHSRNPGAFCAYHAVLGDELGWDIVTNGDQTKKRNARQREPVIAESEPLKLNQTFAATSDSAGRGTRAPSPSGSSWRWGLGPGSRRVYPSGIGATSPGVSVRPGTPPSPADDPTASRFHVEVKPPSG